VSFVLLAIGVIGLFPAFADTTGSIRGLFENAAGGRIHHDRYGGYVAVK
jgi:hypothetical protein